jgi:hypothetical protein
MHPIAEILEPVLGRPSWLVQLGYGTFITMEFGEPQVHLSNPVLTKIHIDGAPEQGRTRRSTVGGQWHLSLGLRRTIRLRKVRNACRGDAAVLEVDDDIDGPVVPYA